MLRAQQKDLCLSTVTGDLRRCLHVPMDDLQTLRLFVKIVFMTGIGQDMLEMSWVERNSSQMLSSHTKGSENVTGAVNE